MTDPTPLWRLERAAWTPEAIDFTPWLAAEANIALLGDAIGLVGPAGSTGQDDRSRPFGPTASVMRRRSRPPVRHRRLTNEASIARLGRLDGRGRSRRNTNCDRLDG